MEDRNARQGNGVVKNNTAKSSACFKAELPRGSQSLLRARSGAWSFRMRCGGHQGR